MWRGAGSVDCTNKFHWIPRQSWGPKLEWQNSFKPVSLCCLSVFPVGKWSFQDVQLDFWAVHKNRNLQITFSSWAPRELNASAMGNWATGKWFLQGTGRWGKNDFGANISVLEPVPCMVVFCAPAEWRDGLLSHQEQPGKVSLKWVFTKQIFFSSATSHLHFLSFTIVLIMVKETFLQGIGYGP